MGTLKKSSTQDLRPWQVRIFSTVWITYFAYYLCRYNMSMVSDEMGNAFSWDESQIGTIFSALTLMYALGQFVNGQLTDRFGGRLIAGLGVVGSVSMNIAVFLVILLMSPETANTRTILLLVVIFWGANGFFQAMGWTPMVRIMAHWFSSKNRGRVMGLMGTCYQFGGAFSWFLAFFIVTYYAQKMGGDWRVAFVVPAGLFAVVGVIFFVFIRNAPEDVGLSPIEAEDHSEDRLAGNDQRTIAQNVLRTLKNPYIWIVALTFFLLDMNRFGFVNWLPKFLAKSGESIGTAGFGFNEVMKRIIHPLAGSAGAITAGWATDRFFKGRRAPVIAFLLTLLGICSIVFPYLDPGDTGLIIFILAAIGFCTYGPHILMVGHAAQDFGKKSGAAGAAGFIDGMGYIGASLAGWGAGALIDIERFGYEFTFVLFGLAAILGALLVCLIWKAGPRTHTAG